MSFNLSKRSGFLYSKRRNVDSERKGDEARVTMKIISKLSSCAFLPTHQVVVVVVVAAAAAFSPSHIKLA